MLQDWSSAAAYAQRMTELAGLGMNAANMISNQLTDQLFASTGQDWYWNISGHDLDRRQPWRNGYEAVTPAALSASIPSRPTARA